MLEYKENFELESVYGYKKCARDLKYIGSGDKDFENGKIYQSAHFAGFAYKINVNINERTIGSSYFERVS